MKIFLDTANLESIRKFNDMGLLDGITTNPSLMSKEGGNPKDLHLSPVFHLDASFHISEMSSPISSSSKGITCSV